MNKRKFTFSSLQNGMKMMYGSRIALIYSDTAVSLLVNSDLYPINQYSAVPAYGSSESIRPEEYQAVPVWDTGTEPILPR